MKSKKVLQLHAQLSPYGLWRDTVASKGIIRLGSQECDATAKYLYMSVPMTQHAYFQVCLTCDTDVV